LLDGKDSPNWVTNQGTSINPFWFKSFNLLDKTGDRFTLLRLQQAFRLNLPFIYNSEVVALYKYLPPEISNTPTLP